MQLARHLVIVFAVSGAVLPLTARECLSGFGFNIGAWGPCGGCGFGLNFCLCPPCIGCHQRPAFCGCAAPVVAPPPTVVPSVSYRQEQYVTYRDIPQTQVRREAYVETVPVTSFQPVTRTVYVPQQVTELVPQTAYQQQLRYRDVAYQSVQRVAETHTRLVPQQTVSFAQPVSTFNSGCAAPMIPSYGLAPSAQAYPTATPTSVSPVYSSPAIPTMPGITVSPYATSPVPQYPEVPSAGADRTGVRTSSNTGTSSQRNSMFRPAPSAARVQQSPRF